MKENDKKARIPAPFSCRFDALGDVSDKERSPR